MAANHISPDKVVGSFFNRASRSADISGNVLSDHLVTKEGRKGRRTPDKVKVLDDIQFPGRVPKLNDVDQIIRASTAMGANTGLTKTSSYFIRVYFEEIGNESQYILNGGNYAYIALSTSVANNVLRVAPNAASGPIVDYTFTNGIPIGEWITLALVYDNNIQSANLYVNGISSDEGFQPLANSFVVQNFGTYRTIENLAVKGGFKDFAYWTDYRLTTGDLSALQFSSKFLETADNWLPMEDGMLQDVIGGNDATITADDGNVFNNAIPVFSSFFNEKGYNTKGVFNGTTDYIDYGSPAELEITGDISFGAWVNVDNSVTEGAIISKYGFLSTNNRAWQLRITSGLIEVYLSNDGTIDHGHYKRYQATPGFDVTDGNWHFVAVTFKASSSELKIYIDNSESVCIKSKDDPITSIADVSQSVYVGAIDDGSPVTFLKGRLRGAFVYNRVLTNSEVSATTDPLLLPGDYVLFEDFEKSEFVSFVPAQVSNVESDVEQFPLKYKGGLAPRIQLVNAPCVVLNGTDQSINLPYETQVAGDQDTTFWFKVKINPESGDYTVFGSGDLSLFRWSTSDTTIRLRGHTNSAENIMTFPHSIRTGEWQDVVLIRKVSDSKFTCYINGVQNTEGYISVSSGNSFRINSLGEGSTRWTDGEISLFGKWFRSFSLAEIQALSTQLPSIDSVEDLYVFSEGSGSTVYDISGNNKHATIVNAILPDVWGKQGVFHYNFIHGFSNFNEITLDGTSQYLSMDENFNDHFSNDGLNFQFFAAEITFKLDSDSNVNYLISNRVDNTGYLQFSCWNNFASRTHFHIVEQIGEFSSSSNSPFDGSEHRYFFAIFQRGALMVAKFFMDGEFLGEISQELTNLNAEPNPITIGNTAGNNFGLKGGISDIKLWSEKDRTLTEAEIDIIGSSSVASYQDNPVLRSTYWYLFKDLGEVDIEDVNGYSSVISHESIPVDSNNPSTRFNKYIPAINSDQDALGNSPDDHGYDATGLYNGTSDINFPDIPEMPADLRGKTFNYSDLRSRGNTSLFEGNQLLVTSSTLTDLERKRSGFLQNELFLDKYPGSALAWADRRLTSSTNILGTVKNQNTSLTSVLTNDLNRRPDSKIITDLSSGDIVSLSQFYDQSGNGVHGTTSSSLKEPIIYDGSNFVTNDNGERSILFDGVDDQLDNSLFNSPDSSPFTAIVIASNKRTGVSNQGLLTGVTTGGSEVVSQFYMDSETDRLRVWHGSPNTNGAGSNTLDGVINSNLSVICLIRKDNGLFDVYSNGIKYMDNQDRGINGFSGIRIGNARDPYTFYWFGNISGLIFYNSDKTSEIQGMTDNLKSLYNIN